MRRAMVMLALLAGPAAAQTEVQTAATAGAAWRKADAEMASEWARTNAFMKRRDLAHPGRGGFRYAPKLLDSQRAWIAFRNVECLVESGEFAGGPLQWTVLTLCKVRLTQERTQQLVRLRWKRP